MRRGIFKSIFRCAFLIALPALSACSDSSQGPPPASPVLDSNKKAFTEGDQETKGKQGGVAKGIKGNLK